MRIQQGSFSFSAAAATATDDGKGRDGKGKGAIQSATICEQTSLTNASLPLYSLQAAYSLHMHMAPEEQKVGLRLTAYKLQAAAVFQKVFAFTSKASQSHSRTNFTKYTETVLPALANPSRRPNSPMNFQHFANFPYFKMHCIT